MRLRARITLLFLVTACATPAPGRDAPAVRNRRVANLQRAATLPWRDGGQCVVREAAGPWPVVAERCFHALDTEKVRFHDRTGRCTVASAEAAAMGLGICILAAPEILVGAVILMGAVVVGVAIKEALDAYALRDGSAEDGGRIPQATPAAPDSLAERKPRPEPSGQDWLPPVPPRSEDRTRSLDCTPQPVPHLGGDALHNRCADRVPQNDFPGSDVLVNGKRFDALQLRLRVLWEVKTDNFDTYRAALRRIVIENQVEELQRERALAQACGFDFRIGVRSAAHKAALALQDPNLTSIIIVMDWC